MAVAIVEEGTVEFNTMLDVVGRRQIRTVSTTQALLEDGTYVFHFNNISAAGKYDFWHYYAGV